MKFYGILCALVALALLLTPAIAMKRGEETKNTAEAGVNTELTTAAAEENQTEMITTDGE